MMKYILDSNVFIEPHRTYYAFDFAPGFWKQFANVLQKQEVIVLDTVYREITEDKSDRLAEWIRQVKGFNKIFAHKDTTVSKIYGEVLKYVETCGFYKTVALVKWAQDTIADPWLIAAAKAWNAIIITKETKKGQLSQKEPSASAKIPDVAAHFEVRCENLFFLMREMGIRWK